MVAMTSSGVLESLRLGTLCLTSTPSSTERGRVYTRLRSCRWRRCGCIASAAAPGAAVRTRTSTCSWLHRGSSPHPPRRRLRRPRLLRRLRDAAHAPRLSRLRRAADRWFRRSHPPVSMFSDTAAAAAIVATGSVAGTYVRYVCTGGARRMTVSAAATPA